MIKYTAIGRLLCIALIILLITSCKSTKTVVSETTVDNTSTSKYLESVVNNAPAIHSLASKIKLSINLDGKALTVSGTLKMKKNEGIQISIAPILGIEVAKIEITPENILIIDRINKQYVQTPIARLKAWGNTDLDFYSLQALFFNELFLPGVQTITSKDFHLFTVKKGLNDKTLIQIKQPKDFDYRFTTITQTGQLTESSISTRTNYQLNWRYGNFTPFSGKTFPTQIDITLLGGQNKGAICMELSKMGSCNNENLRTETPKRYKQMDINELIKQLLSL